MEKNKVISKLCCLETTFYIVFLTILILHYKKGLENRTFALLIFLSFLGCAVSLALRDYLKNLLRNAGFDVAGVHDKKSLEKELLKLQNADDTLDVGVMMFDLNNLKKSTTPTDMKKEICLFRHLLPISLEFSQKTVSWQGSAAMNL